MTLATVDLAPAPAPTKSPRAKGPLVWLDMDQTELDNAYDQSVYAPNQPLVYARMAAANAGALARLGKPRRFQYGAAEIESVDVYCCKSATASANVGAKAPINIYIHGGAWRNGRSADFTSIAEPLVNAGAHSVIVDFNNIDDVGGNLMTMVRQVRGAVAWVYRNARQFGGDPDRIHVTGHSSGSHLAGCVVTTDWLQDFGLPKDILKGAVLVSGMYELKPVRLSKRSKYVNFTDEIEHELSAIRHIDRLNCPIVVAHGTQETPEFQRQAREFVAAVKAAGKPVQFIVGEGYNHFEIRETICNPYGLMGRLVLEQMGLVAV
jgi:arylformamidase